MGALDDALAFAARFGWRVFPSVNKRPAIRNWPNECSRDPEVIRGWWQQWPNAVPSLVTGPRNGVVVLDIDVGTDKDGREFSGFDSLETVFKWSGLPTLPVVHTPRGGAHLYYSCPRLGDDEILTDAHPAYHRAIRNSVGVLAPHVDVRGWNGAVVLPAEGSGYMVDPELNFDLEMPPAPKWFNRRRIPLPTENNRYRASLDPDAVLAEACRRIRHAPEGVRHDTYRHETFRIARLVALGLLDERAARNDLAAEVMALGVEADGHTRRVDRYFRDSWDEGMRAAWERRRR